MAERGFTDPVADGQRMFRSILSALSEPGRILPVAASCRPPEGVDAAAAALVLALCDGTTPLFLGGETGRAADYFRFHTGAPIAAAPGDASFLLAPAKDRPELGRLKAGLPEYPDQSATLILTGIELRDQGGWRLTGPGIQTQRRLEIAGLDPEFVAEWRGNHARFPLGVDILFASGDRIAGLPRTTRIEESAP